MYWYDSVCLWYEQMVSWMWMCLQANGWMNDQWMEWMWLCCTGSVQYRLKNWTVLSCYEAYIYIHTHTHYDRSVWERDQRETRDETGIKSVHLEDCFRLWLAWTDQKDTNNKRPNQCTSQQHYIQKYGSMCIRVQNNDGKVIQLWGKGGKEIRTKALEIISCQKKKVKQQ